MSISTSAGPETFALRKKVSFWHDDVTVLRSLSHLSHYSSSSSGYEGSNESGLMGAVQDDQKVKKKQNIQQNITNKNNNKNNKSNKNNKTKIPSTDWPPLPLEPNKDLPPHYSLEHKPALHRVIPKAPAMPTWERRTGNNNNNLPLPQIRKSKTYTSGLSSRANHQSDFQKQQEEAPLPPLLLVPEDALDRKRQADTKGLSSVAPTNKKSFGNLSLFIPKLAPKDPSHTLSHGTAATSTTPKIPRLANHLLPPIQLDIPKKRVSKIPESISLQNFKRAAKGSMFKSAKQEHRLPDQSSRKGLEVDNMEQRPRKMRQSEIRKTPTLVSRPRYSIGEPRHSPVTLRRKLEQPLPIHSHYVQRQQERLKRQSQEDLLQQQTLRVKRQSQEDLRQAQRLRRQSQENLQRLQELQAQRLARRQSQEDLKKAQQQRLQRRQSQEILQQQRQRLLEHRSKEEVLLQQRQRLRRQSEEQLTPKRTIPDAKPLSNHRRHTTLEEDLKAWKEKYHTIANLPTHLPEPEPISDDRKKAIAATLNSLKVFKRQSLGPNSGGLAGSSDYKRRPDASNNRTLVNLFNKPEEISQLPARVRESKRYKEEEFDVVIPTHPPSKLSNQHEDMDGLKLQTYIEMYKSAKSIQSFWVGRFISLRDRLINTYPHEKEEIRNRMLWNIFGHEVDVAFGSDKWDEYIRFKNNMIRHCWDLEEKERDDSD